MYSEKVFRRAKKKKEKTISGTDQRFFAVVLPQMDLGWYMENESFCLNNREICD